MKTAAALIRVSTDDQMEYSPESQLEAIRKYCKANDMLLPEEYIFMEEKGVSGKSTKKRNEFNKMIGLAKTKPKPFDVIVVWKFSRFARNREDSVVYKSMLRKQLGIDVISVSENIGDDKMSILIEALIEAMDEYYSINLAEEVKRGMTEKAKRGEPQAKPPYGYGIKDNQYYVIEEEAEIVRMIFNDFNECGKFFPVIHKLNSMGFRTRQGNSFIKSGLKYILQNPVYIGKMRWNPAGHQGMNFTDENFIVADAKHEPIIDEKTFNKVQEIIAHNKATIAKYAKSMPAKHWLSGLVFCGDCGRVMIKTGGQQYSGYNCNSYFHGGCSSHFISTRKIEQAVLKQIQGLTIDDNTPIEVISKQSEKGNEDVLSAQLSQATKKLERAKQAYIAGVDTLEEYQSHKAKISAEIAEIQAKKNNVIPNLKKDLTVLKKTIKIAQKALGNPNGTNEQKREALRQFIKKIVYDKQNNDLRLYIYTITTL